MLNTVYTRHPCPIISVCSKALVSERGTDFHNQTPKFSKRLLQESEDNYKYKYNYKKSEDNYKCRFVHFFLESVIIIEKWYWDILDLKETNTKFLEIQIEDKNVDTTNLLH